MDQNKCRRCMYTGKRLCGLGCIVRDDRGGFIRERSRVVRERFVPREAKTLGLKEAMSWIKIGA